MRTIETMVTFRHPLVLTALETAQPPGTYRFEIRHHYPGTEFVVILPR